MRNTTVGSSAMRGFNNLLNLTHLYLECPPQYRQKETSIPVPSTSQHCPESSDEDCEEVNLMQGHENSCVIVLRFGGSPEVWHNKKCVNDCCSNGEQSKILHVRQNLNQGEGTSKQEDGSGSSGTTAHHKEEYALTSSQKVSSEAGTKNAYKISIGVENVKAEGKNSENDEDSVLYVRNAINNEQSKPVAQKQTETKAIKMGIKLEVSANAGASRADAGTSFHTDKSTDTFAEKSSGEGESPSDEKEHGKVSSSEFVHCDIGGIADKTMDESVRAETLDRKSNCTCEGERNAEGSESSDDTSDDEANSEGNSRQSGSRSRPGKKSCSGRLRSVELFSSARNAKCARTSCLGGRHEDLIDDLSIDYFLSRDMWRVSLDGNIVRCNDRNPQLHTLVIRYYPHVTDKTLIMLLRISSLRYVDVTGTKVTEKGVEGFRRIRPDVTVVSDFGASQ
ncbi:hypothetical protein PR048_004583 [Dryococelus australis]|uniref:Uncharacterized protein n=1 Tax=Dryococelus australis TaxID=614101 RepID=A0ABQ9I5V0_9NEOP|nr:hypothetical protein PR048_004583 [Dryococelus australis]